VRAHRVARRQIRRPVPSVDGRQLAAPLSESQLIADLVDGSFLAIAF